MQVCSVVDVQILVDWYIVPKVHKFDPGTRTPHCATQVHSFFSKFQHAICFYYSYWEAILHVLSTNRILALWVILFQTCNTFFLTHTFYSWAVYRQLTAASTAPKN